MPKKYSLSLEESQVIFFAEMIAIVYCSTVKRACLMVLQLEAPIVPACMEEVLQENLRALLREPLRNPHFRKTFNEHFQHHVLADVREVAWAWMKDVLVWES